MHGVQTVPFSWIYKVHYTNLNLFTKWAKASSPAIISSFSSSPFNIFRTN